MPKLILQGYAAIEGVNLQVQPFSIAGSRKKNLKLIAGLKTQLFSTAKQQTEPRTTRQT
jgi:hypothetical protein